LVFERHVGCIVGRRFAEMEAWLGETSTLLLLKMSGWYFCVN